MIPAYLSGYEAEYEDDPREAARTWFDDADFGLFVCYGLYSILGEAVSTNELEYGSHFPSEWVQYANRIPVPQYETLQSYFTAEGFDADAIASLADSCGMEYVTFTARFSDSFCLFETDQTKFTSVNAPANRDLVSELANACQSRGLGLFLYYSHGLDWRHPHGPTTEEWGHPARPEYDQPPGSYARAGHDRKQYIEFMKRQVKELLSNYGPIAGIWLDPSCIPQRDPDRFAAAFDLNAFYEFIRDQQPQVLISYKEGVTGAEDFVTVEHDALDRSIDKPAEVCTTMIPSRDDRSDYETVGTGDPDGVNVSWGYSREADGKHRTASEVRKLLETIQAHDLNLLLNTGLRPDGSLDPEDIEALRNVR